MGASVSDAGSMRILIVDDEPPARARLAALVGELDQSEVVAEVSGGLEALRAVARDRPDIVLLDIRMPGMDGLEVARHLAQLEQPPGVIFTTAYDSHALAAFETNAVDYLLKPIRKERLSVALERAQRLTRAQLARLESSPLGAGRTRTHISATLHGELRLVPVEDVRYFRAEDKYTTVRYPQGQVLIEESLAALEQELGDRFLRVHRNALVALPHVSALQKSAEGQWQVSLDAVEEPIAVSRRLAAQVRKTLKGRK